MSESFHARDPLQDTQSVTSEGKGIQQLPAGVTFYDVTTHVDYRGAVCELFDLRWGWRNEPLVFAYCFTVRPGIIKGWGVHEEHEDRYFILFGEMEAVLFDDRPDSPTRGLVSKVTLSEYQRRLMNIPAGIWHVDRNIDNKDAVVINFPTKPYDHKNPDKYRLPLDTDKIPYKFDDLWGG